MERAGGHGLNIGGILINKEIPTELLEKLENTRAEVCGKDEKILFAVVGDLTMEAKYGISLLAVTEQRSFAMDADGKLLRAAAHAD